MRVTELQLQTLSPSPNKTLVIVTKGDARHVRELRQERKNERILTTDASGSIARKDGALYCLGETIAIVHLLRVCGHESRGAGRTPSCGRSRRLA